MCIIDRTIYTIVDEGDVRTTITLHKFVADFLQTVLFDVHAWIQMLYDGVAGRWPRIGRMQKGDLVRALALRDAIARGMAPDL